MDSARFDFDNNNGINYINIQLPQPKIMSKDILTWDSGSESILGSGKIKPSEMKELFNAIKTGATNAVYNETDFIEKAKISAKKNIFNVYYKDEINNNRGKYEVNITFIKSVSYAADNEFDEE